MENTIGTLLPAANPASKLRILLQTITHLVPGFDREEKLNFFTNKICQLHWKRDVDFDQHRIWLSGDNFGLKNMECLIIIDHHGCDHTIEEEKVPVVWYRWTGEYL